MTMHLKKNKWTRSRKSRKQIHFMVDIIKIVESREKSGLLIDGAPKTVIHEIGKQKGGFLGAMMEPMVASLMSPMATSLMHAISGKGVTKARKGQESGLIPLLALPLMIKVTSGKGVQKQKDDIIIWIIWIKSFSSVSSYKQYRDY